MENTDEQEIEKDQDTISEKVAHITGRYNIISAIIGAIVGGFFTLVCTHISITNTNLSYNSLQEEYAVLTEEYLALKEENNKLHNEIKDLNTEVTQLSIAKENTNEMQPIDNKSVFDLPAINSKEKYWFDHSDQYPPECFIDTDGLEHYTGTICFHYGSNKNNILNPTYQLDDAYSECVGEMVCSSVNGDSQEKAWLEFYSGDQFLGSTDPIDINSGSKPFTIDIKGVKELTIVRNGTESDYGYFTIIYDYLNLVK